jgi:hypothetical protein
MVNKSIENHYLRIIYDDTDIVADDRSNTSKTFISCGYDGWIRPQFYLREKIT